MFTGPNVPSDRLPYHHTQNRSPSMIIAPIGIYGRNNSNNWTYEDSSCMIYQMK